MIGSSLRVFQSPAVSQICASRSNLLKKIVYPLTVNFKSKFHSATPGKTVTFLGLLTSWKFSQSTTTRRPFQSSQEARMADSTQSDEPKSTTGTRAKNDLSDMRKPYRDQDDGIEESQLPSLDPIKLFQDWFEKVKESNSVYEPNAFCICTANKDGQPSARMVLLKGFDEEGFRFFSHYSSQKGRDIAENPKVAMLFYWDSFNRQVRVEGKAERLPQEVAEAYFKRRPQSSQIGAAISDQCSLIESREALMKRYDDLQARLGDEPPPKPATWGGFLIRPERFEFWQGNTNRVHDRIMFRRPRTDEKLDGKLSRPAENGWVLERMLP